MIDLNGLLFLNRMISVPFEVEQVSSEYLFQVFLFPTSLKRNAVLFAIAFAYRSIC